jgi:uncharacterized membrane protein YhaH (DUF805 family)
MDPNNPYRSPLSDVTPPAGGVDTTNPFDPSGRFTRLSWLAWNLVLAFAGGLILWALMIAGLIAMPSPESTQMPALSIGAMIGIFAYDIVLVVFGILLTIRRFHDMDASGWWTLTIIVPLANLVTFLVLLFKRGTDGPNRFGPPRPTAGWEKVLGIIYIVFLVLVLIGVVAAIAIPAFVGYQQHVVTP